MRDMRQGRLKKINDCTHTQHNIDARGGGMRKLNRNIETKQMITLSAPYVRKSNWLKFGAKLFPSTVAHSWVLHHALSNINIHVWAGGVPPTQATPRHGIALYNASVRMGVASRP